MVDAAARHIVGSRLATNSSRLRKSIPQSLKRFGILRFLQATRPLDPLAGFRSRQGLWCSVRSGLRAQFVNRLLAELIQFT